MASQLSTINSQLLQQHFDTLAESSDAVAKLRDLVFQLAVRGLLVPQNNQNESGTELLKRILDEKRRLTRDGVIKKTPILEPITADACPVDLPTNWAWGYLNDFGDWGSGSTPNRANHEFYDGTIPWLKSGELNDGIVSRAEENITELALEKCSLRLNKPGDVLFAMYGATVGKVAILGIEATTNQAVCACTCFSGVFNLYLFVLLKAFKQQFIGESAGAAQPNFSKDKIIRTIAPLPPLAEQRRIVAEVEELLALCDQLEARQTAAREHRTRLVRSALDHLTTAQDEKDFQKHSTFILQHSSFILEDVPALRQAILSLAVQGHLVPHENARDHQMTCSEAIEVFPIPAAWQWVTFQTLTESAFTGLERSKAEQSSDHEFAYMKMNNITREGGCDLAVVIRVDANAEEVSKFRLQPGDFLFNTRNSFELVGKTCVFQPNGDDVFLFNNNMLKVSFVSGVDQQFINLWCCSPIGRSELTKLKSATTNVAAIYQGKLATLPVPLPPLAEQQRIVAKVDELLRWCDALEARLTTARTTATRLLETTLHHLLTPAA